MDINLTLIIQMLVFLAFVWFTMKFVWPPLAKAMEERQEKIANGLSAAERGQKELELAKHMVTAEIGQAKAQAATILEKANKQAAQYIEEAKAEAKIEAQKQLKLGQEQLVQEINRAKDDLRKQVADLAISGAELILKSKMNTEINGELLDDLIKEI